MKKIALATVAISALLTGVASAADLAARPYTKAPPIVAPVFSWTGCYIGVNGGYGWGDQTTSLRPSADAASQAFWNPAFAAGAAPSTYNYSTDGGLAGGQVGCNWQTGRFVLGIEGDIDWADIGGSQTILTNVGGFAPGTFTSSQNLSWLATIRGRAGFTATDSLLLYVTGGVAFGNVNYGLNFAFPATNDFHTIATSNTETGWTVGAGAEWAFTPNWTVKAEYLYVDLGDRTLVSVPAGRAGNLATTLTANYENKYNIVRVGLNYKFGGPVVARY
ncbi:MAG: porin family protein [Bradyrhizobium sp.]|nr:porin family protein [Bradyrhizobium sp.]